ncbi:MAG: thioesterase family protein [Actinomycetes bacterium]
MSVAAPFAEYRFRVPEALIDYNGHMNDAAYAQVLTDANELFLEALGMSASYRDATGCSLYTVEMNIRFRKEVSLDDELHAETRLVSHDRKRVRLSTTVLDSGGDVVATGDSLYLHVDSVNGGVTEFPQDRAGLLLQTQLAHDALAERSSSARS